MGEEIVYFEIVGGDGAAQRAFYEQLFGWSVSPVESTGGGYGLVAGAGIAGGLGAFGADGPSYVTVYVHADDPVAALERAAELGAEIVMPAREVAPGITAGMFRDPAGHALGVMRRAGT